MQNAIDPFPKKTQTPKILHVKEKGLPNILSQEDRPIRVFVDRNPYQTLRSRKRAFTLF
jgi:hypothetical protein